MIKTSIFVTTRISILIATLGAALCATASSAAEYSSNNSLGFTYDGQHFVFEEFGSTDGLGLPYVNLFAIDIGRDAWVKGTPIRLRGSEEEAIALEEKLNKAGISEPAEIDSAFQQEVIKLRQKALERAAPVLKKLGKLWPAEQRAHNPPHEFTTNAKSVRFSPVGYRHLINAGPEAKAWRLELKESTFPATKDCYELYDSMKGFTLTLIDEEKGIKRVLNDDKRVPKSRNCPQKYYIEEVLTYRRADGSFSLAVMVRYARPGFEGPDGRFLTVTASVDL